MSKLDRTGLLLSAICLVHCAALPIVVVALPLGAGLLADHASLTHWLLLGLAIPISGYALWRGVLTHRNRATIVLGVLGLAAMLLGVSHLLSTTYEIPLTLAGSVAVATAHLINLRLLAVAVDDSIR